MRVRYLLFQVALAVGVVVSSTALAQDDVDGQKVDGWKATFEPDAVNSYVEQDGLKYIVVDATNQDAADQDAADQDAADQQGDRAAAAFAAALREGSAALVMDGQALGDVAGMEDTKIVDKANALPVGRVAILRVFPGGNQKPDTAVVTVRDTTGETIWGVSGPRGASISAKAPQRGGMGVSRNAAEAVGEAVESQNKADTAAHQEYARRFIWFQDMVGVNQYGNVASTRTTIYKGKYKKRISWQQFYREVGRTDLADRYDTNVTRMGWGVPMTAAGGTGTIGGAAWILTSALVSDGISIAPLLFTAGSAALLTGGIFVIPGGIQPVSDSKARELADTHNQQLKDELGLSEGYSAVPRASKESIDYQFSIGATPGGAAGVLRIQY